MARTKELLELADHIEKLHFIRRPDIAVSKKYPKDKQFNLRHWDFDCGMPMCAGGHALKLFPHLFDNGIDMDKFATAFDIFRPDAQRICLNHKYKSKNPNPKTVAKRIREVVERSDND